jgi:hypothetical protein
MKTGELTANGFKQMVLLGKTIRQRYINKLNFLNLDNIDEEFMLISSPYDRALESGVGYVLGLLPEYTYHIYDSNNINRELFNNVYPPIILGQENSTEVKEMMKGYNFVIENDERDLLFHSRRCKFNKDKDKNKLLNQSYQFLKQEEREEIYDHFAKTLNVTLKDIRKEEFSDKLARSLFVAMECVNVNYKEEDMPFKIPDHLRLVLRKLFAQYLYLKRTDNDEITKITSSPFFEHLYEFFAIKVGSMTNNKNFTQFFEFKNKKFENLKFVSYSGHDYNMISLIKNLLSSKTLNRYLDDFEQYQNLLLVPFGSNFDFILYKNRNNEIYVKILLNGKEIFEHIRSEDEFKKEDYEYEKNKGIKWEVFEKILKSRIHHDFHSCLSTRK